MPELPEVETIRRQLGPELAGRRFEQAWTFGTPKFAQAPHAVGAAVVQVGRRGKYLLVGLDDERELIVHLGMTGSLSVVAGEIFVADAYVRAWWALDDGRTLAFRDIRRFGRLAVVARGDYAGLPTLAAAGPEPFDEALTAERLWRSLRTSRARVKTQLLSQRPLAGVGNIYADEALWRAGIHPAARTVTKAQAARLLDALREVLAAGIANRGTTLRDYRSVDGSLGDNQHHLDCYGRGGRPCRRCANPLTSRSWDGRTTTFCPRCQARR